MKVGDKVKVTARKWGHAFMIGEVVTLCALDTDSVHRFKSDGGMRHWMWPDEYEAVTTEIGTLAELGVKPGDVVEFVEARSNTFDFFLPRIGEACIVDEAGRAYGISPEWDDAIWRLVSRACDLSKQGSAYNTERLYDMPPPSGPVITETVTRFVPGVYGGGVRIGGDGFLSIEGIALCASSHRTIRAAIATLTQIADAMPSE